MNQFSLPTNPHAIIEISRPGFTDGQGLVIWDSWQQTGLFKEVSVELPTNQSAEARWTFFDPKFRLINSFCDANGIPMTTIRVFIGYGAELGEPIFKGVLAQIERGDDSTSFIAFDMGFKMKLVKKAGYKNKKDDLAILKDLATRNGLKFEGPDRPLKLEPHKAMMQDEQTDWEHAMERARDSGLVLFVRQDTLFAKYPAKTGDAVLRLENRKDFVMQNGFDFIYRTPENLDGRPRKVVVRRRGKGGKRVEGASDTAARGQENVILRRDGSGKNKAHLTKRAQAQKELEREHAFEGHLSCVLPPDGTQLDVRNTISVEGISKLFSGKYICDTVAYKFAPGILNLDLNLYRDINL